MSQTIKNPIITGFSPDPSICVVGDTYFVALSSFHFFPGIPIYASKDLVNWSHIGNGINRREQLDLATSLAQLVVNRDNHTLVATGGLYAPTIRYRNNTFYISCTNAHWIDGKVSFTNFIIQSSDIWSNEWSNPVLFDFHGIDPNIFFDDDGRAYIQGSRVIDYSKQPSTTIDQFEIDINTGEKLSEQKTIWGGFTQVDAEGPRLYKRGPWYYLVVAEGGTFEHHVITTARSKNIWGPYESAETNPILPPAAPGSYIQQTGHPDFFQDTQGDWWSLLLGTRKKDDRFPMGREIFLTRLTWPSEDVWPVIAPVQLEIPAPKSNSSPSDLPASLPVEKTFLEIRNGPRKTYKSSDNGRNLSLTADQADLYSIEAPAFVGLRQRSLVGTADACLQVNDRLKTQQFRAGLALYKDENRFVDVHYESETSSVVFRFRNNVKSIDRSTKHIVKLAEDPIQFQIRYTEESYEGLYRIGDKNEWVSVGSIDSRDISGFDFTGPIIGIFATSPVPDVEVTFTNFGVDKS